MASFSLNYYEHHFISFVFHVGLTSYRAWHIYIEKIAHTPRKTKMTLETEKWRVYYGVVMAKTKTMSEFYISCWLTVAVILVVSKNWGCISHKHIYNVNGTLCFDWSGYLVLEAIGRGIYMLCIWEYIFNRYKCECN